ncbi:MAG: glycosyltransferase [Bacteroidetes bacterium]|nr:glycosyltransferase [Bacteroidota bacterium]
MPHLREILTQHLNIPIYETPAFIADYFFKEKEKLKERKKQIVIYPKTANRDYEVIYRFLHNDFKQLSRFKSLFASTEERNNWKIIILKGLSHKDVAKVLKEAEFFICLNTHEAFNSSVPEAMAAGCINFTYDAMGPADFLVNDKNALVFNNNHVFKLYEKLLFYIKNYQDQHIINELKFIRENAYDLARSYTTLIAEQAIIKVFMKVYYNKINLS